VYYYRKRDKMKGIFLSFEGPDGSGKTTQISILKQYLESNGYNVLFLSSIIDLISSLILVPPGSLVTNTLYPLDSRYCFKRTN